MTVERQTSGQECLDLDKEKIQIIKASVASTKNQVLNRHKINMINHDYCYHKCRHACFLIKFQLTVEVL